jgi:hypothetical protein
MVTRGKRHIEQVRYYFSILLQKIRTLSTSLGVILKILLASTEPCNKQTLKAGGAFILVTLGLMYNNDQF